MAIAEGPSDEVARAQLIGIGMTGNVLTMTIKVLIVDEFAEVLRLLY